MAHPFIVALSMGTDLRDLVVAALGLRAEKGRRHINSFQPIPMYSDYAFPTIEQFAVPPRKSLVLAAAKYGYRDVQPVMDALDTTVELYRTRMKG
jgi:hypothetical protein